MLVENWPTELVFKVMTLEKGHEVLCGFMTIYSKDCSIAEINPLVTTKDGDVIALDAKLNFDDNALLDTQKLKN
jgi:succinyl-CoA synthetase beta subunit